MLDETLKHAGRKTIGLKQTQRALEKGSVERVYVARDADARIVRPIRELCQSHGVECVEVGSMSELGRACGIEVGAAVAAILADRP
ncbi:50S ribosomal protein L30e-like [Acididesulfobacillus acetoxydans]|uniref:50S ribosomal protein L30e-like n=1 Tax=Acididesulfobacillus acetoxydans TaxID=1561005 RepID=A0A8S0Y1Z5_9FIRM|nr:ribosomal L7Ae/L30e/S12e/Gadd45 family protein [Acididesulfobacillus acetoxydans]KLU59697.1 ribosome-associated protein L7Ae-like protein [Peptococcaceae bacterium CEB3]CAA7600135.1 50S ribosomal protein L30e-like [Acididesulfobacillus acetoxydans]CEJ09513.1 RNA 2-O ribose methyltransferase, substrate binding [Acididesulfobacillus acetoxydans]